MTRSSQRPDASGPDSPSNPEKPSGPEAPTGRAEILAAATDLFGEYGYDRVSMNAIAQRASISKANVFHHFGSKEALYLDVMREACGRFTRTCSEHDQDGRCFRERLLAFLRRDVEAARADPDPAHLILREVFECGPSRGRALAGEVFDEQFAEIVALFEQGQAHGVFASDVPPAVAAIMAIACNSFLFQSQHVLRHLPGVDFVDDPERYAALVGRVLLDGLRRDPGSGADGSDANGESEQ